MHRTSGPRLAALLGVLVAGGLLTAACARPPAPAAQATGPLPAHAVARPAGAGALRVAATISGRASALVYDPARDGLWYLAATDTATDLRLYAIATGTTSSIRLPALPADGSVYRKVAVAPDGSVWVASGYLLLRVDADRHTIGRTVLPLTVAGMLPGALDPNTPLPGTWVSAMTFTADASLVVARNNVPFLQVIGPNLAVGRTIALPAGMDGLSDMALGPAGLTFRPSHVHAAPSADAPVAAVRLALAAPPHPQTLLTDSAGPRAALAVTGPDGQSITFDAVAARLTWSTGGSSAVRSIALPSAPVRVASPTGKVATVMAHAQVIAATLDGRGGLWYLQVWAGKTQLMRV